MRKFALKTPVIALAVIIAAGVAGMAWFIVSGPVGLRSVSAHVAGAPLEIKVLTPGPVRFIATAGSNVKTGDTLLKIGVEEQLEIQATARQWLDELNGANSETSTYSEQHSAMITRGYLAIPESAKLLATQIEERLKEIALADEQVTEQSVTHVQAQLELRKLELKTGRIAEDEARLLELRKQEEAQAALLAKHKEERDALNLHRSDLEKRLRLRTMLEEAFAELDATQQAAVQHAIESLGKMQEAETDIARSNVQAPIDGLVLKVFLQPDEEANFGQLALLLVPEGNEAFWVSAVFNDADAKEIALGANCQVEFTAEENFTLPGLVRDKLPPSAEEQSAGQTRFKIILQTDDPAQIARLYERQAAQVVVPQ